MQSFIEHWGYLAILILTILESACIPIPSEVTLGLAGALAAGAVSGTTHLNLAAVIVVGTLGSVAGSYLAYAVGRTGGRTLLDRVGRYVLLTRSDLDRTEEWFARGGDYVVLYGRVVPIVRTFVSLPAGMARMSLARFSAFTVVGCAAWVTALSVIGYEVGGRWRSVTSRFSDASYVVAGIVVVAVAIFVVHRLRALRAERAVGDGQGRR